VARRSDSVPQLLSHQRVQAVEAFAQIARLHRNETPSGCPKNSAWLRQRADQGRLFRVPNLHSRSTGQLQRQRIMAVAHLRLLYHVGLQNRFLARCRIHRRAKATLAVGGGGNFDLYRDRLDVSIKMPGVVVRPVDMLWLRT
jgi:hypothetical protein